MHGGVLGKSSENHGYYEHCDNFMPRPMDRRANGTFVPPEGRSTSYSIEHIPSDLKLLYS